MFVHFESYNYNIYSIRKYKKKLSLNYYKTSKKKKKEKIHVKSKVLVIFQNIN